jgi:hypothetical protein
MMRPAQGLPITKHPHGADREPEGRQVMYHPAGTARPIIQSRDAISSGNGGALLMPASRQAHQFGRAHEFGRAEGSGLAHHRQNRLVVKGEEVPSQSEFYRMFLVVLLLSMASISAGVLVGLLSAFLRS